MENKETYCPILCAASAVVMATLKLEPEFDEFKAGSACIGNDCAWFDQDRSCCVVQKGA